MNKKLLIAGAFGLLASAVIIHQTIFTIAHIDGNSRFTFSSGRVLAASLETKLLIKGEPSEAAGVINGSVLNPTIGPAGTVEIRGTGSVGFAAVQDGQGVFFKQNGAQQNNSAFYKFTGTSVGNIFNPAQGEISFYWKSAYNYSDRIPLTPGYNYRYAFAVNDGSAGNDFYFYNWSGKNFIYNTGATAETTYSIPSGQEDILFGKDKILKIRLTWDGTQNQLYFNDQLVKTTSYTQSAITWNTGSLFTFGSNASYGGGFNASDDVLDEFMVSAPVGNIADSQPPIFTNINSSNITSNGVTINWNTDEPSDTQVEYGLTTSYGASSPITNTGGGVSTSHSLALSGLSASSLYHYRVKSKDAAGNLSVSADATFTTSAAADQPPVSPGAPVPSNVLINFDNLSVTAASAVPGSSSNWIYTSKVTNPDPTSPMTAYNYSGWRSTVPYPSNPSIHNFIYGYSNGSNSDHLGFEDYHYFDIDDKVSVSGNSLKYTITGGKNDEICGKDSSGNVNTGANCTNTNGLPLTSKEQYLQYLANGQNPIAGDTVVGSPYLYFANNSTSGGFASFPEAANSNRLSIYIYLPSTVSNGTGAYPPDRTFDVGPYTGVGGHWYDRFYTQGGGWTHVYVDGHPYHNNAFGSAANYPYPSSSVRSLGSDYFTNMYRFYVAAAPPTGIGTPPFSTWFDDVEFQNDNEPQNNETINDISILYKPDSGSFEIGFSDKYKNNQYSFSTYELRYSFSPITNANWTSATPANILADSRFGIQARSDGKFAKDSAYYPSVWAPFTIASADLGRLTVGSKIYFAVKDISQLNGDGQDPVVGCGIGAYTVCGRDYKNHASTFDYAGDQPNLNLIKRIDYTIAQGQGNSLPVPPVVAPVISSFIATPSTITSGQSTTLSWSVSAGASLSINQSIGSVSGTSKQVSPTVSTTYTLTATNSGGSSTKTVTVTVAAPAAPVISNLVRTGTTANSALISWLTDQLADTQIEYGLTSSYGLTTTLKDTTPLTFSHSVTLVNLFSATVYHFRTTSKNTGGLVSMSGDFTFTTLPLVVDPNQLPSATSTPEVEVYIPMATATPQASLALSQATRLVNDRGTYYLIIAGIKHGITNPGMLYSYGFRFQDAKIATAEDQTLQDGSLLLPKNGSLVKSKQDPTVYFISQGQRFAFTSAKVFLSLGFKFSSVLVVTDPELQALPKSPNLVNNGQARHLPGLDINRGGTVYWVGDDNALHAYPSVEVYNSWRIANDFSTVVPANNADNTLPVGDLVGARLLN